MSISRTSPTGVPFSLGRVTTRTGGTYGFIAAPPTTGIYTYTASYVGSATQSPASVRYYVTVTGLATTLRLATSASTVNYEGRVTLTATLGKTDNGRAVSFYAQSAGSKSKRLIGTATANSRGVAAVTYGPPSSTYFSATFWGDQLYAPVTATVAEVSVRAGVSQVLSGYYKSETYQGTLYRVYHDTATLDDTISVTPNKADEYIEVVIDVYLKGAWRSDLVSSGYLWANSTIPGAFGLARAAGARYRLQASYQNVYPSKAKDITNLSNDSTWLYFAVTT